jgi:signal transduction histidine kinase
VRFQHADGNVRIMEGGAVNRLDDPSGGASVVNARDVTERRRLEDQLRQAQKMEAVGQLAGGVAHDFNNLLTAILGYANLNLYDFPEYHPMLSDMEEIRSAGEPASSVTRQLLSFSRLQMLQPQIVDINALIRQLEKLLRGLVSAQIEVAPKLAPDLAPVKVDPGTMEQVLVNLCVNAKDAMPHGGSLTIETANVTLTPGDRDAIGPMPPGRYVLLAVGDTGEGMDEATSARVFEPFFTTREQGRGSGLGLATVYGMVKQSGGYIWVHSEPGRGTTFKIYLPPAESVMISRSPNRRGDLDKRQGWETVLLVEDEDAVRSLARAVLRRHGYTVLEARHGVDALRLAERHRDDIHLLLTDTVMPHMNGPDLAKRLESVRPNMKVLFMSGYVDRSAVPDFTAVSFLPKPFTPETLARKVRLILDRTAETGVVGDPEV